MFPRFHPHLLDDLSDAEMDAIAHPGLSDESAGLYPTLIAQDYLAIYRPIIDHELFKRRLESGEATAVELDRAMRRWAAQRSRRSHS